MAAPKHNNLMNSGNSIGRSSAARYLTNNTDLERVNSKIHAETTG